MPSVSIHLQKIKEHSEEIEDAIKIGLERRPATIAFHASACSIEFLETYLHKLGKIPLGFQIKHDWFKRPKKEQLVQPLAERRLRVDFPAKNQIFENLYEIEERRNKLIYGKPAKEDIEALLAAFEKIKSRISDCLKLWGTEI